MNRSSFGYLVSTFAMLSAMNALATDAFDPSTNVLTLDSVSVSGTSYANVVGTLDSYSLLDVGSGAPSADTFDPATNLLHLGSITSQGTTYNNVRGRINAFTLISFGTLPVSTANQTPPCSTPTFISNIQETDWVNIDITPNKGTSGLRAALNAARDSHPNKPVRIRLAPGTYIDTLGSEIYAQRLLRTSSTPIYIVANDRSPNATVLGHGINLLGVSYIGIDGVTIGPSVVGAWTGSAHNAPQPLQAAAGIHVAGAALNANQNAGAGGVLNSSIYGQYAASHHIYITNVTIQNLFELDAQSGETSQGQGMDGMKFNQVEDLWVLNNTVSQTSRHGIDNVGVHRALFCNNTVSQTGGGQGIEAKGGSVDVTYDSNTFNRVRRVELGGEDTDATYYFSMDGLWNYEALRTVARNNLIINPREAGLEFSGCADCTAVGNTIFYSSTYQVPIDQGTVYGGDAIRVHDSQLLGASDGAGSDCQFWNGADYVTVDRCWGVGSNSPAPIKRVLRTRNVTVVDNVIASVNGTLGNTLGGSVMPCPLNVVNGTADLHFDANYWWNASRPLPTSGCSALPEGAHSVLSTTGATLTPGFGSAINDNSTSLLKATANQALKPPSGSPVAGTGISNPSLSGYDRVGVRRRNPPAIGAMEP